MKREGNLYLRIAEPENLRLACLKASRGKRNRPEVIAFRRDLDNNLAALHHQLIERDVLVGEYRFFRVYDPKERQICAASFRERILHHAIMNMCEPVLERYAIADSFACRKGKGHRNALARTLQFVREDHWYLKLDIRKYFDSIDQQVLLCLLSRRFKDCDLLELVSRILKTYATQPGKGLPIGNLLSQHFANFYLGLFDHWVKEDLRVKGYLRYMDDFVLFGKDRDQLKTLLQRVETFLAEQLSLRLKDNRQLNRCTFGVPFLGFRVLPGGIRLAPRSKRRFLRKFRHYEGRFEQGDWSETTLARHVTPLVEFIKTADSFGFRRQILQQGISF